jgi:hypothetical protein
MAHHAYTCFVKSESRCNALPGGWKMIIHNQAYMLDMRGMFFLTEGLPAEVHEFCDVMTVSSKAHSTGKLLDANHLNAKCLSFACKMTAEQSCKP